MTLEGFALKAAARQAMHKEPRRAQTWRITMF